MRQKLSLAKVAMVLSGAIERSELIRTEEQGDSRLSAAGGDPRTPRPRRCADDGQELTRPGDAVRRTKFGDTSKTAIQKTTQLRPD